MEHGVARLGRSARRGVTRPLDITRFVGAIAIAAVTAPRAARTLWWREARDQVLASAVRALPFVGVVAALLGVTIVVQARAQGLRLDVSGALGGLLVAVVVRELGPLLAAVIVVARSGTAMAAELAAAGAFGEIEAMDALGVDPLQYFAVPRVVGTAISVAALAVFFNAFALVGSGVAARVVGGVGAADFAASLRAALAPSDLWLTVAKGLLFGAGVAAFSCYAGLLGARTAIDVPRSVTRGVAYSLLFVFGVSALFSLALYT
jgi:phospholipid/cholesterol/gamma-HCH transport system permease protein